VPQFSFTQGLEFSNIVSSSEKLAWTVEEVFKGKNFDPAKPFAPASWLNYAAFNFLSPAQTKHLNHIRAFSYIHMLGNYEDFITRHFAQLIAQTQASDPDQARARFRFCDEEMKHQQLFARAEVEIEKSCDIKFSRYFDKDKQRLNKLTQKMLKFSTIARAIILQAFEWGTQRHYVESIKNHDEAPIDPLFALLLKSHWLEESQHVKTGALEIQKLATKLSAEELTSAFDEVLAIAGLIGETFVGQVDAEIETLNNLGDQAFTPDQQTQLQTTLLESMTAIWAGVAMSHPSFCKLAMELSPEGAAKLGIS